MASSINASTAGSGGVITTADNSGVLNLQTAGTTAVTINTSQNVGIGTTSPREKLEVAGAIIATGSLSALDSSTMSMDFSASQGRLIATGADSSTYAPLIFGNATTSTYAERMRITSAGDLLVNTTNATGSAACVYTYRNDGNYNFTANNGASGSQAFFAFRYNGSGIGSITGNNTATAYNTFSDYRLKDNVAPMTGALAKVAQLKPVTYKWKLDSSDGEGFIAHELAQVCPLAVTGEKDAVDEEGNIKPQGIDTSFLVATLTAAIQEQQALITQLQADVATLKGAA